MLYLDLFSLENSGSLQNRYSIKIIDVRKRSKWIVCAWHDASNEKFDCPTTLKARLVESFPQDLSDDLNFQVGYYMGKNGAKRWIIESRDLESMYSAFKKGSEIHLWCESKREPDDLEPPQKRAKTTTCRELFEEEVDEIFVKLKEKNSSIEAPKL